MKRSQIITKPTKISDITFDDLYDEISHDWQLRARRLQARRWRTLKHSIKGIDH